MTLEHADGRRVGETALDAVAQAGERFEDGKLQSVSVRLVIRTPDGRLHVVAAGYRAPDAR